jgi:hypothetical protein
MSVKREHTRAWLQAPNDPRRDLPQPDLETEVRRQTRGLERGWWSWLRDRPPWLLVVPMVAVGFIAGMAAGRR